ncbi:MAG TPA: PEPxxWA-CTERM sorting domain-containing protein [Caulobacteraceae bacterium]
MERDYSLASVIGASAGVAGAVLLATLVIAAPHLGSGALADWGSDRHSHRGHKEFDDSGQTGTHKSDCGASCAGPVHGVYDGGGAFAPPITPDPSPGGVPGPDGPDGDQGHTINGGYDSGHIPGMGGGPFESSQRGPTPSFFTGTGGSPSGFLGSKPAVSTPPTDTTPPPTDTTPPTGTTPTTPTVAVPEPATWAFMLVGLGAVGAALRSRRGSAHAH